MIKADTLVELLQKSRKLERGIVYLEGDRNERRVSNAELEQRAFGILYHLQKLGAKPGDHMILCLSSNEQFIDAFWAAVVGGIIPVPIAPGIADEHRHKLLRVARKLGKPFLYTDSKMFDRLRTFAQASNEAPTFKALEPRTFLVERLDDISRSGRGHEPRPNDPLFIQFSSGSTSEPKGVLLTHANVIANARGVIEAAKFTSDDVSLSWMPLTHDMGLVGFHFMMFVASIQQHLMSNQLFVRRPRLWMEFAARYRATITCSPNFGYRHFLKVLGDEEFTGHDLSSIRLIFNGAEPIAVDLCEEFLTRLAPAGLSRNAMYPVYGLAEASLAVSFPPPGAPLRYRTFDRHHLNIAEPAGFTERGSRDAVDIVSVGRDIPHCEVRLTDDADQVVPDGSVGHIQMRGANVTQGYYADPEVNAASFAPGGWLKTGDLGLRLEGDLYITGRFKDIIFVNGQNYYPHDLEEIGQAAAGLELNKIAVAGVRRNQAATDDVIAFVLHRGSVADFVPVASEVSRLINQNTGLEVAHVVPVKRIPKTTSGKLQRHLLATSFLDGEFDAEVAELEKLRAAQPHSSGGHGSSIANKLKIICDSALTDRTVGLDDNLFDIGVSSLKLVEIHEGIDREFPGQVDLTEIFDYPTIAELAGFLEKKLAAG